MADRAATLRHARFPDDHAEVLGIFREYVLSPRVSLAFQDYEAEFAALPGPYAAPRGSILLAWQGDAVAGCGALRPVDATCAELKRVYLRPAARGLGLGRRLVETLIADARRAGYQRLCLDVLPEFTVARTLYGALGFQPAPPVSTNPVPGTAFLGLDLRAGLGG